MSNDIMVVDVSDAVVVDLNISLWTARKRLEQAISGLSAESVRDSDQVRKDVKQQVDDILGAFNF
jgi:hypothetical protein